MANLFLNHYNLNNGFIHDFLVQYVPTPYARVVSRKNSWSGFKTSPKVSFMALAKTSASVVEAGTLEKETMHLFSPTFTSTGFALSSIFVSNCMHEVADFMHMRVSDDSNIPPLGPGSWFKCGSNPPVMPHTIPGGGRWGIILIGA